MSDEENKPEALKPEVPAAAAAPEVVPPPPPAAAAAPEGKPPAPLGRNGRPVFSRHYAPLLLAVAMLFGLGCAGTPAGNELDRLAGIKKTVAPDGTVTYEKLPSSPIQDTGSIFGPTGALIGSLVTLGIYGIRQLGNSVPKDSHDKALVADPGPGEKV